MINKSRLENLTNEVWKGAIKLRGKFKAKDYPSVRDRSRRYVGTNKNLLRIIDGVEGEENE